MQIFPGNSMNSGNIVNNLDNRNIGNISPSVAKKSPLWLRISSHKIRKPKAHIANPKSCSGNKFSGRQNSCDLCFSLLVELPAISVCFWVLQYT